MVYFMYRYEAWKVAQHYFILVSESFGSREFLMFAYHWTTVVYDLSVVAPSLLLHQHSPFESLLLMDTRITFPPNFLFRLLRLTSLLHPLTHSRVLEMWTDVVDLKNDRLLSSEDVNQLLNEVRCRGCPLKESTWNYVDLWLLHDALIMFSYVTVNEQLILSGCCLMRIFDSAQLQ